MMLSLLSPALSEPGHVEPASVTTPLLELCELEVVELVPELDPTLLDAEVREPEPETEPEVPRDELEPVPETPVVDCDDPPLDFDVLAELSTPLELDVDEPFCEGSVCGFEPHAATVRVATSQTGERGERESMKRHLSSSKDQRHGAPRPQRLESRAHLPMSCPREPTRSHKSPQRFMRRRGPADQQKGAGTIF
jgi:hypothetical protein